MIPILYEKNEVNFTGNGLFRLRDCISCIVTEGRNEVYECNFEYPVTGLHFDEIILGRIIAVTHDDTGDIQPFDIVGFSKPINGVVTFHSVHISYRLNTLTIEPYLHANWKSNWTISELSTFLTNVYMLGSPGNKFSFDLRSNSAGSKYMSICDDPAPKYLRSFLGGVEGSLLDTFGGEFLFDRFKVYLKPSRGVTRNLVIRYGLNMTDYNEDADGSDAANGVIGYWKGTVGGSDSIVVGKRVTNLQTYTGRIAFRIYDYTSKFSSAPDITDLQNMAESELRSEHGNLPASTIKVSFVRLQDSPEYDTEQYNVLMQCQLCDSITVVFPDYNTRSLMKIVKVEYDVLSEHYTSMELGELSTTLSQALGVSGGSSYSGSSGGGGGTTDYNDLTNKPQINSQTLTGNKTASDLGLVADSVTTISPTITASTGTLVSYTAYQFGKVVFLTIAVRKTSSTASGANIFTGTLSTTAYRPKAIVTGASYYDAHAISAQINTSGAIVFRNASPTAVTIGSSYSVAVSFTYMID